MMIEPERLERIEMEEHKSQYEEDGLGIVFSLKYLLLNAITGQLEENEQIENILKSRYEMEKKEKQQKQSWRKVES